MEAGGWTPKCSSGLLAGVHVVSRSGLGMTLCFVHGKLGHKLPGPRQSLTAAGFQGGVTRWRLQKRLRTKSCLGLRQFTWVSVTKRHLGPDQPGRLRRRPASGPVRAGARAPLSTRGPGRRTCPHSTVAPGPGAEPRLHFLGGSGGRRAQGSPESCYHRGRRFQPHLPSVGGSIRNKPFTVRRRHFLSRAPRKCRPWAP